MRLIPALAALLLVCASPVLAADVKDVVATLEEGYRTLNDVQGEFSQRSTIPGTGREQKGGGEFAIRKNPGGKAMFRFDYRKPQPQNIICNGKTLWLYQPENRQVIVSDASAVTEGDSGLAATYLTGLGSVSRDFTITMAKKGTDAKGNYVLELVPKKASKMVTRMELTISREAVETYAATGKAEVAFPVISSVVHDATGAKTALSFSGIRANRGIAPSKFTFRIPKGIEIIRPGQSGLPGGK